MTVQTLDRPARKALSAYAKLNMALAGAIVVLAGISLIVPTAAGIASTNLFALWGADRDLATLILVEIRLPRAVLGCLVGATLGLCGAALQGLLRNPLAEPGLIGVSGGAALGAVLVFYFAIGLGWSLAVPLGGVAGAVLALVVLYVLAGSNPRVATIILAGVAINSFAGALTSLALNFAPNPYAALEILFWLLGSLTDRSREHVLLVLPFMAVGWALVASAARALDALTLGEDTATSLGFDPLRVKLRIVAGTGLAVGAAVSVTGVISFIGLIVPHLLRPFTNYQPGRLLLPSALAGAALLTAADLIARSVPTSSELRIGVVTALIGAPFFLTLILKTRKRMPL